VGNTVLVVEHDKDMMVQSDYVVDIGPKAGKYGGQIVFAGTAEEFVKSDTLTAGYINGHLKIEVPSKRRKGNGKF
jgi:excinuclease ABC subunit A